MSKDGKSYVLLGNLYLSEDKITQAIDAIEKGIKKGGLKNTSQVYMARPGSFEIKASKLPKNNSELLQDLKMKRLKRLLITGSNMLKMKR